MDRQLRGTPQKGYGAFAVSPRPLDKKNRRLSAPGSTMTAHGTSSATKVPKNCSEALQQREWVTTAPAAWRTLPSSLGFRIDTLPKGWQVVEAAWMEEAVAGWLPIVPRGYVQVCDVARVPVGSAEAAASADIAAIAATPERYSASGAGESSITEDAASAASTRAALLALREEHVRLREANVVLRERELAKRREIDDLCRTRESEAKELQKLQRAICSEKEELEHYQQQRHALRSKLERCREVIAKAVESVDQLYEASANSSEIPKDAVDEASKAGLVVADMLLSLADSPTCSQSEAQKEDKFGGQENADRVDANAAKIKLNEKADKVRNGSATPFRDLNNVSR